MTEPDVTVIVGVYNARDYVEQCLESVATQSLAAEQIQLIVVDDGSTDGSSDLLATLANRYANLQLITQPNSGGPAGPRNTALEHAEGRFVFFLDADDYLAPEALERMVSMADGNETDIVVGKYVGIEGRQAPRSMFTHDQARTDIFSSRAYWTLNPLKLFRRNLIEEHHLRFPPELPVGQDQPFVAQAYLHANAVSILTSYDCYYYRLRGDGSNNTEHPESARRWLKIFDHMIPLVRSFTEPGPHQDLLLRRHFQSEQRDFVRHLLRAPADDRVQLFEQFRTIVRDWASAEVCEPLPAEDRLRLELTRRGELDLLLQVTEACLANDVELHFENGHAFAMLPGFRDDNFGIPDSFFEVTGELKPQHTLTHGGWHRHTYVIAGTVHIPRVKASDISVELVINTRGRDTESVVRAGRRSLFRRSALTTKVVDETLEYRARLDFSRSSIEFDEGRAIWDIGVRTHVHGITAQRRIGQDRISRPSTTVSLIKTNDAIGRLSSFRRSHRVEVKPYLTNPFGNVSFKLRDPSYTVASTIPKQATKQQLTSESAHI